MTLVYLSSGVAEMIGLPGEGYYDFNENTGGYSAVAQSTGQSYQVTSSGQSYPTGTGVSTVTSGGVSVPVSTGVASKLAGREVMPGEEFSLDIEPTGRAVVRKGKETIRTIEMPEPTEVKKEPEPRTIIKQEVTPQKESAFGRLKTGVVSLFERYKGAIFGGQELLATKDIVYKDTGEVAGAVMPGFLISKPVFAPLEVLEAPSPTLASIKAGGELRKTAILSTALQAGIGIASGVTESSIGFTPKFAKGLKALEPKATIQAGRARQVIGRKFLGTEQEGLVGIKSGEGEFGGKFVQKSFGRLKGSGSVQRGQAVISGKYKPEGAILSKRLSILGETISKQEGQITRGIFKPTEIKLGTIFKRSLKPEGLEFFAYKTGEGGKLIKIKGFSGTLPKDISKLGSRIILSAEEESGRALLSIEKPEFFGGFIKQTKTSAKGFIEIPTKQEGFKIGISGRSAEFKFLKAGRDLRTLVSESLENALPKKTISGKGTRALLQTETGSFLPTQTIESVVKKSVITVEKTIGKPIIKPSAVIPSVAIASQKQQFTKPILKVKTERKPRTYTYKPTITTESQATISTQAIATTQSVSQIGKDLQKNLVKTTQIQREDQKLKSLQAIGQVQMQQQKTLQKQILQTTTMFPGVNVPTFTPPILPPLFPPIIPISKEIGLPTQQIPKKKKKKLPKAKYKPSFIGVELDIKAPKPPKIITGVEIRPIV